MGVRASKGSVKPHGAGIQVTFHWRDKRWRPTLPMKPTPPNLKYARTLLAEINERIRLGSFRFADYFPDARNAPGDAPRRQSFGAAAKTWIKGLSELQPTTIESYEQVLKCYWSEWDDRDLASITASDIKARLGELGLAAKTRNNALIPLRGVLSAAFDDGAIAVNPAAKVKNMKPQREPPDPLELPEVDVVLSKLDGQVRNYFEFAFFTGMRPSEQIALTWGDIDWTRGTATVRRARVWGHDKDTKTHSVRDVELTARALAALKAQRGHTELAGGVVFHNPNTGKAWDSEKAQGRAWTAALKRAKLRHRPQYQTRHTFATQALMSGCNPMWVARQMGHANSQMLHNVYAKWLDAADRSRERGKFDAATQGASDGELGNLQPLRAAAGSVLPVAATGKGAKG